MLIDSELFGPFCRRNCSPLTYSESFNKYMSYTPRHPHNQFTILIIVHDHGLLFSFLSHPCAGTDRLTQTHEICMVLFSGKFNRAKFHRMCSHRWLDYVLTRGCEEICKLHTSGNENPHATHAHGSQHQYTHNVRFSIAGDLVRTLY